MLSAVMHGECVDTGRGRRQPDQLCDASVEADEAKIQKFVDEDNWRLRNGLQIVDICFPCSEDAFSDTVPQPPEFISREQRPETVQRLCDPFAYKDASPVFPTVPGNNTKEKSVVKGGFIPGATNIALFFETQLVMAVLTERVLVLLRAVDLWITFTRRVSRLLRFLLQLT